MILLLACVRGSFEDPDTATSKIDTAPVETDTDTDADTDSDTDTDTDTDTHNTLPVCSPPDTEDPAALGLHAWISDVEMGWGESLVLPYSGCLGEIEADARCEYGFAGLLASTDEIWEGDTLDLTIESAPGETDTTPRNDLCVVGGAAFVDGARREWSADLHVHVGG